MTNYFQDMDSVVDVLRFLHIAAHEAVHSDQLMIDGHSQHQYYLRNDLDIWVCSTIVLVKTSHHECD
jgi:hypothetical protein